MTTQVAEMTPLIQETTAPVILRSSEKITTIQDIAAISAEIEKQDSIVLLLVRTSILDGVLFFSFFFSINKIF